MTPHRRPPSVSVAGWTVTQLDVGAIHAPLTWVFPDAAEGEMAWLPSNALLCCRADDVVLVDCGLGPFGDVFDLPIRHVELDDALGAAGRATTEVSTVVLTHLDADHAGGVVAGEPEGELRPSLGNARIVLSELAAEVLVGAATERSDLAETIGAALREAGVRIEPVGDATEAVPGLRLRSVPGHRAGHACVELSSDAERFVYLADAVHAREHVEHPEWDFLHDSDPAVGLSTRRALIEELAGSGTTVACSHVDGFGRIERRPDGTPVWVDLA